MRPMSIRLFVLALCLTATAFASAEEPKAGEAAKLAPAPPAAPEPKKFVTEHRLQSGGVDLAYTATAEEIQLKDGDGKPTASFFTISYVKKGVSRP